MSTSHEPQAGDVAARHLDQAIAELLGGEAPPDVSARVARQLAAPPPPRRRSTWLQVACALLGLGVVLAIAIANARDGDRATTQQPPLGPEVVVTSLAEIERLPITTDNVRLQLHTADAVRALTRLRSLRRLDASHDAPATSRPHRLTRPEFFPDAAAPLGMLTSLEELDVSGHAPVAGLDALATLSRLRRLRIFNALIDPTCLTVLKQLPRLEEFELEATLTLDEDAPLIDLRDPDHGLVAFASSGRLRSLVLTACIADAAGMRAIASNPLRELDLYGISGEQIIGDERHPLDAAAFVPIGGIRTLRELSFRDAVSAELLAGLRELPELQVLDLGSANGLQGTAIGRAVARLPHVRTLSVSGSDVDTAALLAITEARGVVDLTLGGDAKCTDAVIAKVCAMPSLRRLTMPIVPGFSDDGMAPLADTRLEYFRIVWAKHITAKGLQHLPKTLREVEVEGHMLDAAVLQHLGQVPAWTIDGRGPATLIADMHASPLHDHLRALTLRGDLGVLDSLAPLAAFEALRTLDLRECFGDVADEALQRLRERGITVRLPLPPQDDPDAGMVFQVDEIVEQGGGGK